MQRQWHRRKLTYTDGEYLLWKALDHLYAKKENEACLWLRDFINGNF